MLALVFEMTGECFALDARDLRSVLPDVPLRAMPGAAHGIVGLLDHRGSVIPVVDLALITTGRAAVATLGTRIVVARYRPGPPGARIGLRIENIDETVRVHETDFMASPIAQPDAPWLGRLARVGDRMVQVIDVAGMLTEALQENLYPTERSP